MGWFGLTRNDVRILHVDGRAVILRGLKILPKSAESALVVAARRVSTDCAYAATLPRLEIIVNGKLGERKSVVVKEDFARGIPRIYLNRFLLAPVQMGELVLTLKETVERIYKGGVRTTAQRIRAYAARLQEKVRSSPYEFQRIDLGGFLHLVKSVGLMKVCDNLQRAERLDEAGCGLLEERAREEAEVYAAALRNWLARPGLGSAVRNATRDTARIIGEHIVVTLLKENADIEAVADLKPLEAIQAYEQAMRRHGRKPVVSVSSGRGTIDYAILLKEWREATQRRIAA